MTAFAFEFVFEFAFVLWVWKCWGQGDLVTSDAITGNDTLC